jgi:hypothetical protein
VRYVIEALPLAGIAIAYGASTLGRLLGDEVPTCLVDAIVAVSRLIGEHPEIVEVDVNPLLVSPQRAVALDCLIVLGAQVTPKETE